MSTPKNSNLDLVKKKGSIKKIAKMSNVLEELNAQIKALGDISSLVDDPDIVEQIMQWVENITVIKLTGQEKSDLVIKLLVEQFPALNNDKDMARLQKQINSFVANGTIKKVATSVIVSKTVCSYLKKSLM